MASILAAALSAAPVSLLADEKGNPDADRPVLPLWPDVSGLDLTPSEMGDDGTLHIPAHILPSSKLITPEFLEAYMRTVRAPFPVPPKNDAPLAEWAKYRAGEDQRAAASLKASLAINAVDIEETQVGGVTAAIITPRSGISEENRNRVLLYLHGGGFFMSRNLKSAMLGGIPIAALGKIKVVALAYRQFPEFRYPAASEDVASAYRALLKEYKADSIGLFGCSAGGVLVGQSVSWFQTHDLPKPGAVALLCAAPMVPGTGPYMWSAGDSRFWGARGNYLGDWPGAVAANGYFGGVNLNDPGAYPGTSEAVLERFPPTLLVSGTRAAEMSSTIAAHAKFLRLGVRSSLYIIEGGWHSAPLGAQGTPEGDAVLDYIARWFSDTLAP